MTDPTGVLWAGPIFDRGGYGNVSRNYVRSLIEGGVPVRCVNLGPDHVEIDPVSREMIQGTLQAPIGDAPLGVIHFEPTMLTRLRYRNLGGVVSSSIFETHSIPPHWVDLSNGVDQVWVPSRFNQRTYQEAGVRAGKLRVIPIPSDCEYFRPGFPRQDIPGVKGFLFLYVFSFGWRKGFDLLLQAYLEEFTNAEDVTLMLKVYKGTPDVPDLEQAVRSMAGNRLGAAGAARVVVHAGPIPQEQLRSLYASCDLYVSTDRANGWGMPCMEAMSMGKACATIDWSGSTEFMTEANSFLIRPSSELEPVDSRLVSARPDLYRDQRWPKVDTSEIRRVLRSAYENRKLLREKGERAAQDMRDHFSFKKVGSIFREVVETFPRPSVRVRGEGQVGFTWKTRFEGLTQRLSGKLKAALGKRA